MQGGHLVVRKTTTVNQKTTDFRVDIEELLFINFTQISDGQYKALFSRLIYKFQLFFFGNDCAHTNSEYRAPFQVPRTEIQISNTIGCA